MRIGFSSLYNQVRFLPVLALFISFVPGCSRSQDEVPVTPPATHPLVREYIGYGVVNVSFTHLLNEPDASGVSLGYLRRGTVVRIIERKPVINRGVSESWVLAEENSQGALNAPAQGSSSRGWLQETTLDVFDNESRANTASKSMNL